MYITRYSGEFAAYDIDDLECETYEYLSKFVAHQCARYMIYWKQMCITVTKTPIKHAHLVTVNVFPKLIFRMYLSCLLNKVTALYMYLLEINKKNDKCLI